MRKITRVLAAAGLAATAVASPLAPPAAEAAPFVAQVCHHGNSTQPPVEVLESGGAKYLVWPGGCSAEDVPAVGFRPDGWTEVVLYRRGTSWTMLECAYNANQWCSTLNQTINVAAVISNVGGGRFR
jgi:hypothetical protein